MQFSELVRVMTEKIAKLMQTLKKPMFLESIVAVLSGIDVEKARNVFSALFLVFPYAKRTQKLDHTSLRFFKTGASRFYS